MAETDEKTGSQPKQPEISDQALLFAQDLAAERAKSHSLLVRMASSKGQTRKLLIADDDAALRMIVRATLEGEGYEVSEAKNGTEALAAVFADVPDVILLDVDMPGMNGLDVCKHVRADDRISASRVIMLSARADPSERAAGIAAGANVYLTKPFRPLELLDAISQAMNAR